MTTPTHQEALKIARDALQYYERAPWHQPDNVNADNGRIARTALAATSQVEAATSEAVLWVESEPSTRGKHLRSIIDGMCHTVMYHSKKPATSNPVWPLYDHAAPQALPATEQASLTAKEHVVQQAQQWAQEAKTQRATVLSILRHFDLPENDWEALRLIQAAQAEPDLSGLATFTAEEIAHHAKDETIFYLADQVAALLAHPVTQAKPEGGEHV